MLRTPCLIFWILVSTAVIVWLEPKAASPILFGVMSRFKEPLTLEPLVSRSCTLFMLFSRQR
jgi:hypothetical protein